MLKRMLVLLVVLILVLGLFASCGNEETSAFLSAPKPTKNYQPTYEISVADMSDGLGISGGISYEFEKKSFDDFKPPQTAKITIDGKELTITGGKKPQYRYGDCYPVYEYSIPETQIDIKMDPFGNVLQYSIKDYDSSSLVPIMTDEEYERIALTFLSNFVECEILSSAVNTTWDAYLVKFAQYVNGIKTSGYGFIMVAYDGQVENYIAQMINQIPKDTVNPFDMDEVKAKTEAYVSKIEKKKKKEYDEVNCTYDYQLTMLADGNLAIICEVEIECANYCEDGSKRITGGLIMLVIQ